MIRRRQPLMVANWKMNGCLDTIRPLVQDIRRGLATGIKTQIVICPPFPYLPEVSACLRDSRMALGAQDISEHTAGA